MVGRRSSSLFVFFVLSSTAFALDKKMIENCSTNNATGDRIGFTLEDGFKWSMDESTKECQERNCNLPHFVVDGQPESLIEALSSMKNDNNNESRQFVFWLGLKRDKASEDDEKWLDPYKWKWATSHRLYSDHRGGNWSSKQGKGSVSKSSEEECVLAEWSRGAQSFVWIRVPCHENETSTHIPVGSKKIFVCQCGCGPGAGSGNHQIDNKNADQTEGATPIWVWIVVGVVGVVCVAGVLAGVLIYRRRRSRIDGDVSTDVKARRSKLSSRDDSASSEEIEDDTLNIFDGLSSPKIVFPEKSRHKPKLVKPTKKEKRLGGGKSKNPSGGTRGFSIVGHA